MEYRNLGRSGVKVSPLCLGTMNFGQHTEEAESFRIMDRALDAGINFFDTANVYGRNKPGGGRSGITEEIIGRWLAQGGGRREKIVLATKVFGMMGEGPNERRLSAYHIRRACDESLRRLQTDHIDLYQMHHIDRSTPLEETWQAMEQLVREGKITYVGSSNFAGWHIARAMETAKARNFLGLVSEQGLYNLRERTAELEVLPACIEYGMAMLPWSPVAGGLLAGVLKDKGAGRRNDSEFVKKQIVSQRGQLEKYEALCGEVGMAPADVALAWVMGKPGVTSPIIGPRTMEQLESGLKTMDARLDDEVVKRLEEIWPGPGKPAPEAYAW